jgi:hypothetical protein
METTMFGHTCDIANDLGADAALTINVHVHSEPGDRSVGEPSRVVTASFASAELVIGDLTIPLKRNEVFAAFGEGPVRAAIERAEEAEAWGELVEGERDTSPSTVPGWEYA